MTKIAKMASAVNKILNGHAAVDLTNKESSIGDISKENSENSSPAVETRKFNLYS